MREAEAGRRGKRDMRLVYAIVSDHSFSLEGNPPIGLKPRLKLLLTQLQERFPDESSANIEHRRTDFRLPITSIEFLDLFEGLFYARGVAHVGGNALCPPSLLLDLFYQRLVIARVPGEEKDGVFLSEFACHGGAGARADTGNNGGGKGGRVRGGHRASEVGDAGAGIGYLGG